MLSPEVFVETAVQFLGAPSFRYKGANQGMCPIQGFDCSGFVRYVLLTIGFPLEENIRHTNEFFDRFGILIHPSPEILQPGDLVFFCRKAEYGQYPAHIVIMLSSTEYIHAPGKNGTKVCINQLERKVLAPTENQLYINNLIGAKRPAPTNYGGRWRIPWRCSNQSREIPLSPYEHVS